MTSRTYYRIGLAVVAISPVLLLPVLVVGSTFTRVALVVSLLEPAR